MFTPYSQGCSTDAEAWPTVRVLDVEIQVQQ